MVKIYTLTDPRDNMVRYVGKTSRDPIRRFYGHWSCRGKSHSVRWVKVLKSLGLKPIMDIIDEVEDNVWIEEEKFYISYFKFLGFNLTNLTEGGEGHSGRPIPKEVCDKIVAARRRNGTLTKPTEEGQRKRMETIRKRGYMHSPEARHRMSVSQKKRGRSEDFRKKASKYITDYNISTRKKVCKFDEYGNLLATYDSMTEAGIANNTTGGNISRAVLGLNPRAKGFYWKYAN